MATKPLIVILGPTASGKTAFSIEVAKWIDNSLSPRPFDYRSGRPEALEGRERVRVRGYGRGEEFLYPLSLTLSPRERESRAEIINADSRQLYRYMDIGTAKITTEEMGDIPHHLFSIFDPKEKVTVGWYKQVAERVIDDILARGNIPILVGGSMLYISAVTDGYVFTGRGGKRVAPTPYDLLVFGMQWTRGELVKRIEERTKKLLGTGLENSLPFGGRVKEFLYPLSLTLSPREREYPTTWLQEVTWLLQNGYTINDPGMKSHGYREIAGWILHGKKEEELQPLIERINAVTRQYAKRQVTWWQHDKRIHWI